MAPFTERRHRMIFRPRVAGMIAVGIAAVARAQSGSMSMGLYNDESSFRPTLSSADLKVLVRVLGLGKAETQAVEDLHAGYAAALRNEGGEVRDFVSGEIEKAQAMQNVGLLDTARQRVKEWEARSEKLKKAFLDDLKSLLSREEEARWPIVERELRRMKNIGNGRLAGETLDVVRLTEDVLGQPAAGELAEVLHRYSSELDYALVARERFLDENQKSFPDMIKNDLPKAKDLWNEAQRLRGAVRDTNERYARLVAEALPADRRTKFQFRVFEVSFPAIVRPTLAEGYLKDVDEVQSLTAEQRSRISAIRAKFEADRWSLWMKAGPAWKRFEADDKPRELAKALGEWQEDPKHQLYTGAWLPESHPLVKYRQERLALDQALRASLDSVLTAEQREAVPGRATHYARFENWEAWGL
jgi:hypothetical protein